MAGAAPHGAPIEPAWRAELFGLRLVTRAIDLHVHAPPLEGGRVAPPRACPVARWHAAHGGAITNRWHQEIALHGELLARHDGTRTPAELAREVGAPRDLARAAVDQLASLALTRSESSSRDRAPGPPATEAHEGRPARLQRRATSVLHAASTSPRPIMSRMSALLLRTYASTVATLRI